MFMADRGQKLPEQTFSGDRSVTVWVTLFSPTYSLVPGRLYARSGMHLILVREVFLGQRFHFTYY